MNANKPKIKDNYVSLSSHLQNNITKRMKSSDKFMKSDNIFRPATSKPNRKRMLIKDKLKNELFPELPDIENLGIDKNPSSEQKESRRKIVINKHRGRNVRKNDLEANHSHLNLIKTTSGGKGQREASLGKKYQFKILIHRNKAKFQYG